MLLYMTKKRVTATEIYCSYYASKGRLMAHKDEECRDLAHPRLRQNQPTMYQRKGEHKHRTSTRHRSENVNKEYHLHLYNMRAEMGSNCDTHSSDSGNFNIIVESVAYPTLCPTTATGMIHNNKEFMFTATSYSARITHSSLLDINSTQEDSKKKTVCVPESKETLLAVRYLTTDHKAVIFTNRNVYISPFNKIQYM